MTCQMSVFVNLSGRTFDFDECSHAIGLTATRTWTRDFESDVVPEVSWSIGFAKRRYDCVDTAVLAGLQRVEGYEARLTEYVRANALQVSLSCDVVFNEERPLYRLSPGTMKRLSELNAEFRLDIYDYSE